MTWLLLAMLNNNSMSITQVTKWIIEVALEFKIVNILYTCTSLFFEIAQITLCTHTHMYLFFHNEVTHTFSGVLITIAYINKVVT